jgi:hypothetical protein
MLSLMSQDGAVWLASLRTALLCSLTDHSQVTKAVSLFNPLAQEFSFKF